MNILLTPPVFFPIAGVATAVAVAVVFSTVLFCTAMALYKTVKTFYDLIVPAKQAADNLATSLMAEMSIIKDFPDLKHAELLEVISSLNIFFHDWSEVLAEVSGLVNEAESLKNVESEAERVHVLVKASHILLHHKTLHLRAQRCVAATEAGIRSLLTELDLITQSRQSVEGELRIPTSSGNELTLISQTNMKIYRLRQQLKNYVDKTAPVAQVFLMETAKQAVDKQIKEHCGGRDDEIHAFIDEIEALPQHGRL